MAVLRSLTVLTTNKISKLLNIAEESVSIDYVKKDFFSKFVVFSLLGRIHMDLFHICT